VLFRLSQMVLRAPKFLWFRLFADLRKNRNQERGGRQHKNINDIFQRLKYVDAKYVRIDGATIIKPIFSMILDLLTQTAATMKLCIRIFTLEYFKSQAIYGHMIWINPKKEITHTSVRLTQS